MASDLTLSDILNTLGTIKNEVVTLSLRLEDVEQRLNKLEYAVYTPPASPSTECSFTDQVYDQTNLPKDACSTQIVNPTHTEAANLRNNPVRGSLPTGHIGPRLEDLYLCTRDQVSDIAQHLNPINTSLVALSTHLSRMESTITSPVLRATSPLTVKPSDISVEQKEACEGIITAHTIGSPSIEKSLAQVKGTPFTSPRPGDQITWKPPPSVRHVFGQPSTPGTQNFSFDITKSPFGNYKSESSPFQQFVTRNIGRPSCLKATKSKPLKKLPS